MYNGVGVATARGTGTSGYVQRNLSAIKPTTTREWKVQRKAVARSPPEERDPWLAQHKAKRQIEVELLKLRHDLEDEGLVPAQIEDAIRSQRHRMRELLAEGELDSDVLFDRVAWEAKAAVAFSINRERSPRS